MSSRPDYSKLPVEKVTTNRPSSSKDEDPRLCVADFFKDTELNVATKGLLEKLVHGGYGTVFQEEQSDSSLMLLKDLVVVKRNFSQSCTIGNIQHVNVVSERGICSENSHRLLVYEYMLKGPLAHI
ncbi:hypothetical protein CQW23_22368 [Capsicum baccatum]|uniref:Protein kinase domain-containing protein n=1 Tax=Capsicum baccatum TaxID=33114 RepID=A0A2G2W0N8_CAPBA|nr:hypothetical protein CQW23_22368 [Capsicum baccatum]